MFDAKLAFSVYQQTLVPLLFPDVWARRPLASTRLSAECRNQPASRVSEAIESVIELLALWLGAGESPRTCHSERIASNVARILLKHFPKWCKPDTPRQFLNIVISSHKTNEKGSTNTGASDLSLQLN